jgi:hypothetical protein
LGELVRFARRNVLFLLRPIDDPEQRKLLQADYHLVDMSGDDCLATEPQDLDAEDVRVTHTDERGDIYCFVLADKKD